MRRQPHSPRCRTISGCAKSLSAAKSSLKLACKVALTSVEASQVALWGGRTCAHHAPLFRSPHITMPRQDVSDHVLLFACFARPPALVADCAFSPAIALSSPPLPLPLPLPPQSPTTHVRVLSSMYVRAKCRLDRLNVLVQFRRSSSSKAISSSGARLGSYARSPASLLLLQLTPSRLHPRPRHPSSQTHRLDRSARCFQASRHPPRSLPPPLRPLSAASAPRRSLARQHALLLAVSSLQTRLSLSLAR